MPPNQHIDAAPEGSGSDELSHSLTENILSRLSLREFVVELLGSFIPGLIFVIFSLVAIALPILLFHETLSHLPNFQEHIQYDSGCVKGLFDIVNSYKAMIVVFVLALGFVFGHIAMSQSLDYPDEKSWNYIFNRLHPEEREKWAARDKDEALFPYANLKEFLKWKDLGELAEHVPWTLPSGHKLSGHETMSIGRQGVAKMLKIINALLPLEWRFLPSKRTNLYAACNKELFNVLKLRIRLTLPTAYADLTHIEANIRLSGTSFYMCRLIRSLCFYMLVLSLMITLLPHWFGIEPISECISSIPFIDAAAFYLAAIIISWQSIKLILKFLHKQRLREVVLVFAIAKQCPGVLAGLGNPHKQLDLD